MQIKAPPQKKLYFLTLPLKKSSVVITCPWWIPWFLNWEYRYFIHMGWVGGGGGSYFPYILLNEIQTMFSQLAKWSSRVLSAVLLLIMYMTSKLKVDHFGKEQNHGGHCFSLLYFGNSQTYWFYVAFQTQCVVCWSQCFVLQSLEYATLQ